MSGKNRIEKSEREKRRKLKNVEIQNGRMKKCGFARFGVCWLAAPAGSGRALLLVDKNGIWLHLNNKMEAFEVGKTRNYSNPFARIAALAQKFCRRESRASCCNWEECGRERERASRERLLASRRAVQLLFNRVMYLCASK